MKDISIEELTDVVAILKTACWQSVLTDKEKKLYVYAMEDVLMEVVRRKREEVEDKAS